MKEYDVIVIGAGPAGSAAAMYAAQGGARTVLLEEHIEVGVPAHCTGGIFFHRAELMRDVIRSIAPKIMLIEINKQRVWAPSGKLLKSHSMPKNSCFLTDRAQFDRELARLAVNAGADLLLHTRATGLIKGDGKVVGVTTNINAVPEIHGKIVIAADGINAIEKGVPKWAEMVPPGQKYWGGISFELTRVKDLELDTVDLFFGAFTKSGHIGLVPRDEVSCMTFFETMQEFENVKIGNYAVSRRLRDAVPLRMIGYRHSWDLGKQLPKITGDGLMLTGSAAGWRGTMNSYATGMCAGQVAAEAILDGDVTENKLKKYEDLLLKMMPQKGYQLKSKVDVYPFYERSDQEIEDLLIKMIEKDELVLPP